jgi:hypothetical protein
MARSADLTAAVSGRLTWHLASPELADWWPAGRLGYPGGRRVGEVSRMRIGATDELPSSV